MRQLHYLFLGLILCLFYPVKSLNAQAEQEPIASLLKRILPKGNDAQRFRWAITKANPQGEQEDFFTLASDGKKVSIEGNNYISIATGINYFLQHKVALQISWHRPTGRLPKSWQAFPKERHHTPFPYRYYLNFCTHSYTMAFWDFARWEQEIDLMALRGINMPLILQGMPSVWRKTLAHYGYTDRDLGEFLVAPTYYAWFFMNNMTGYGAKNLPAHWYDAEAELGRKIVKRLKAYGMKAVVPGYVGMIPKDFLLKAKKNVDKWQEEDIISGGKWCNFDRPAFVKNTERLQEFAKVYYKSIQEVYGEDLATPFYAIDPFHEGAKPKALSSEQAKRSIEAMWQSLQAHKPKAIWVAQSWQANPKNWLTKTVPQGRLLILNLHGDSHAQSKLSNDYKSEKDWSVDAQGRPHQWLWGMTNNFGSNVGLFGRMKRVIATFQQAKAEQELNHLQGISALPEGIEHNDVLYDMLYALPWLNEKGEALTLSSFLDDYIQMRYGIHSEEDPQTFASLREVWQTLAEGIYNCPTNYQQGTTESVFMQRPSNRLQTVSSWAYSSWYWSIPKLRKAIRLFASLAPKLKHNRNYRYDLVDFTRQALADYGKEVLEARHQARSTGKTREQKRLENLFLKLILIQDKLLGTEASFRLGSWLSQARAWGQSKQEKDELERYARRLITTWGDKEQCNQGGLRDYSNREWQGLLSAYYYPRWQAFFSKDGQQEKADDELLDYYDDLELPFVLGEQDKVKAYLPKRTNYPLGSFSPKARGNSLKEVRHIFKYILPK